MIKVGGGERVEERETREELSKVYPEREDGEYMLIVIDLLISITIQHQYNVAVS